MRNDSSKPVVRDRHDDSAAIGQLPGKPSVLRRATIRGLCVLCLAVIVYGTLGPLGFGGGPWLQHVDDWSWAPPRQHSDRNDIFANFLVYVPVGIAFRLLVRRRGRAGIPDLLLGLSLSLALSYLTEVAQQFMPARSANLTDCGVNAVGALFGCLVAPGCQSRLRRAHAAAFRMRQNRSWTLLAWAAAVVTGGLMAVPFWPATPSIEAFVSRPLDIEDVKRFGMFVVLGFAMTAATLQRYGSRADAVRAALMRTTVMAIVFELMQLFLASHACGLLDMAIAALGGLTGTAVAIRSLDFGLIGVRDSGDRAGAGEGPARARLQPLYGAAPPSAPGLRQHLVGYAALFGTIVCVAAFAGERILACGGAASEATICWIPFRIQFMQPFHRVVADIVEALALYGFLTLLCLLLAPQHRRAVALLVVMGLAVFVESARALLVSGVADITLPVLAAAAWILTVKTWNALIPRGGPALEPVAVAGA